MSPEVRFLLVVSGRVQGVLYRRGARAAVRKLSLTGWARNLIDGRVEVLCEGSRENVAMFVEWAKKGPLFAKVTDVEVSEEVPTGEFKDFSVREFGF